MDTSSSSIAGLIQGLTPPHGPSGCSSQWQVRMQMWHLNWGVGELQSRAQLLWVLQAGTQSQTEGGRVQSLESEVTRVTTQL